MSSTGPIPPEPEPQPDTDASTPSSVRLPRGDGVHRVEVPSQPASLKVIRGFLTPIVEPRYPDLVDNLVLAVDECCSNMVKHRPEAWRGRPIEVEVDLQEHQLQIRMGSFCLAEHVASIKPRDLDDVRPGGLGMHFVQTLMDTVRFVEDPSEAGGVTLVLEKRLA